MVRTTNLVTIGRALVTTCRSLDGARCCAMVTVGGTHES